MHSYFHKKCLKMGFTHCPPPNSFKFIFTQKVFSEITLCVQHWTVKGENVCTVLKSLNFLVSLREWDITAEIKVTLYPLV